jgi:wyosine [tRNA(Phe)-imidazoG37] synthetase (radical SAM superfamily)
MQPSQPNTPLFTQHSRNWRRNRYVYPVISRRSKGLSIGINLNTDRICNFDCIYCCVDRTAGKLTPRQVDLGILRDELDDMLARVASGAIWQTPPFDQAPAALKRFNDVAFSGDGEPTSSPVFGPACELVAELLAKHALDGKIVVITNATLLDRPGVEGALKFLDAHNGEIWAKLDAGNEKLYRQMVRTTIPFSRVLEGIRQAGQDRQIVIQSMSLTLSGSAPEENDIADYLQRLRELAAAGCRIKLVQIYTIARPVFRTHIAPLPDPVLDTIAARVRELGLNAEAYYGSAASH